MKKLGSVLMFLGVIVVSVFFVQFMLELNKKDNQTDTITITEARSLVDMACAACKGDDSLSTAAVENYEYDFVRPSDAGGSSYLTLLYLAKYALADSEAANGCFVTGNETIQMYVMYELTQKGIVLDFISVAGEISSATNRNVLELYFSDESKDSWAMLFTTLGINNESEVIANDENNFIQYSLLGKQNKINRVEVLAVEAEQTLYDADLTKENLDSSFSGYIDATNHEKSAKSFGEVSMGWDGSIDTFANEELDNIVTYVQNYAKNAYSPKFSEAEFEEKTDFFEKLMQDLSN